MVGGVASCRYVDVLLDTHTRRASIVEDDRSKGDQFGNAARRDRAASQGYDRLVNERLGNVDFHIEDGKTVPGDWVGEADIDPEFQEEFEKVTNDPNLLEADANFTPDVFDDTYLGMELGLPRSGGEVEFARVVKRLRDKDGLPIGTANDNPILDTRVFEVEFPDGHRAALAANIIAENLFAQVDPEGNRHVLFDEIIDHRTDGSETKMEDSHITTKSGTRRRRETTVGWKILIQWKDGSTTWTALKDVKNAYPVQMAEYAVAANIADSPAFAWWVPFTLRKRERILSKVKSKYWVRSHKFGIKIPKRSRRQRFTTRRTATLSGGMLYFWN